MRKIKLLMMLTLLCVGLSSAWAVTRNYQVVYTGRTTSQGAGYTIKNSTIDRNSSITSGDDAETLVTFRQNNNPTALSTTTIGNYIAARTVADYDANITVSTSNPPLGYYGVITIAYSPKVVRYRVLYEMATLPGTGYTLTGTNPANGRITSAANATVLEIQKTGTAEIAAITTDNVSNFIQARPIAGYTTSYYVNTNEAQLGYLGNIYVNYIASTAATVWTDGIWDYSTQYYRTTGTVVNLPDDECAISLHRNSSQEITEEVQYRVYRARNWVQDGTYTSGWYTYNVYKLYLYRYINGEYVPFDYYSYMERNGTQYVYPDHEDPTEFYPANNNGVILNGSTMTDADNDGDGVGETATYKYISKDDGWYINSDADEYAYMRFTYEKTHSIGTATHEHVVIPSVDPTYGRKVTAIQKWGLAYLQTDIERVANCKEDEDGNAIIEKDADGNITSIDGYVSLVDDHSNWYLKTVTFESPSNLKSIGDYAFMSCKELVSVDIPNTVEFLGQGAFEMDTKLKNVNFQTLDDGTTKIKTIKNFTFWLCSAIETLELPDGITEIEGQQSGASLQYMTSLINLRLPNTLERIGPHFLCSASSLKTLTIPVSVVYIDGASFHGCESLQTVYILGPAAALQGEYAEGNSGQTSSTFSANITLCKEAVSGCTFYTTYDNYEGYKNDPVWSRIDENGSYEGGHHGNVLTRIPDTKRVLMPSVWVTAIFPYGVEDYEATFGEGTLVAQMDTETEFDYEHQVVNGQGTRVYDVVFKLLPTNEIPKNLPVMIKPAKKTEYMFYSAENTQEEYFKEEDTKDHGVQTTAKDGAKIVMKGYYHDRQLMPWDFYFMYQNKTKNEDGGYDYDEEEVAKFYRVPDQKNAATIRACRCYWTINVDNMRADGQAKTWQGFFFDDDELSGIGGVEEAARVRVTGIYDLQGRKLDVDTSDLPQGVYVVNGKKVAVK